MAKSKLLEMTAEASTLGFKPGVWPEAFEKDGKQYARRHSTRAEDGEVQCVTYVDDNGEWLVVFND